MNPLISVILPVYNMEAYLARCLDSVLNSTYQNLEILCVDDGSRDRSLGILREYEAKDSRIVVIAQANSGVSAARNAGLEIMHGDFVLFIDSDDFIHPQAISLLLQAQQTTKADIVIGNYDVVKEKDLPVTTAQIDESTCAPKSVSWVQVFKNYYWGAFCWGRLISAALVQDKRFPVGVRIAEDSIFFTSLFDDPESISCCVIDEPLYHYFLRDDSVTQTIDSGERLDAIYTFLSPEASASRGRKKVCFVFAITRLLRHFTFYSYLKNGRQTVIKIRQIMRSKVIKVMFSRWFTIKEKLRYLKRCYFSATSVK